MKTSLLTAAAAFVSWPPPIGSHAENGKLRQIVIDPSAVGIDGTGGGGKDKPPVILPLVVAPPPGSASVDPASNGIDLGSGSTGGATDKGKVVVAPVATLGDKPTVGGVLETLDAITSDRAILDRLPAQAHPSWSTWCQASAGHDRQLPLVVHAATCTRARRCNADHQFGEAVWPPGPADGLVHSGLGFSVLREARGLFRSSCAILKISSGRLPAVSIPSRSSSAFVSLTS